MSPAGLGGCEDDSGQQPVLHGEHAGRERLRGIARKHGHALLREHVPPVVDLVNEVDRGPALGHAGAEHGFVNPPAVHAGPSESRKQGRMDVDNAAAKAGDHGCRDQLQVSCEHQQFDVGGLQCTEPPGGFGGIRQHMGRHATRARNLEGTGIHAVAEDQRDLSGGARWESPQQRTEIASAPGHGYSDTHGHGRGR